MSPRLVWLSNEFYENQNVLSHFSGVFAGKMLRRPPVAQFTTTQLWPIELWWMTGLTSVNIGCDIELECSDDVWRDTGTTKRVYLDTTSAKKFGVTSISRILATIDRATTKCDEHMFAESGIVIAHLFGGLWDGNRKNDILGQISWCYSHPSWVPHVHETKELTHVQGVEIIRIAEQE